MSRKGIRANDKADFVPLVKPQSNSNSNASPGSGRCKGLVPFFTVTLMVTAGVFFFVAQRAEEQSNPLKVLFKGCKAICLTQMQKRIDRFGDDLLNTTKLLSLVSAARDKAIQSLKVDYGDEYFAKIFQESANRTSVVRKAFVPAESASTEMFKRKLQIKILQVQARLKAKEISEYGCDCAALAGSTNKATKETLRRRRLQENDTLTPVDVDVDDDNNMLAKFIWTTGGHSAAAGHGNLYNESYTSYMERTVKDVFASVGIEFIGKNYAMGGMTSAPEIALCAEAIFGSDTDAVSWDYGMTDGDDIPWTSRMFLYNSRASLLPSHPSLFAVHVGMSDQRDVYSFFEKNGIPGFLFHPNAEKAMHDSLPDCASLSTAELAALPPFVRNFKCEGKIENGDPFCATDKYNEAICSDRKGKAGWHPGWKDHALIGNAMALFLMETLVEAAQDLASHSEKDPALLLDELKALDDADYDRYLKSKLPDSLFGAKDKSMGEMEVILTELKPSIIYRSPAICHTGLLPAETRYQGILTESEKTGMFDYDKGVTRASVEGNPPKEKDKLLMKLAYEPSLRQDKCPVTLQVDYKDFFYTSRADGWTSLTIPNDREAEAYRYDSSTLYGSIFICPSTCDWGQCEEGDIQVKDFVVGSLSIEVNGILVESLVQFGSCHFLKGKNGFKFEPNSEGRFVFRARVNVDKSYFRLSSVILL